MRKICLLLLLFFFIPGVINASGDVRLREVFEYLKDNHKINVLFTSEALLDETGQEFTITGEYKAFSKDELLSLIKDLCGISFEYEKFNTLVVLSRKTTLHKRISKNRESIRDLQSRNRDLEDQIEKLQEELESLRKSLKKHVRKKERHNK